jgi:hypothetical protein
MLNRYKNIKTYSSDLVLGQRPRYATANICSKVFNDCKSGKLVTETILFNEGDRLDHLSQKYYGNGLDWWVIAAASGLGWWLQVNPGTEIIIPTDIKQVKSLYNL